MNKEILAKKGGCVLALFMLSQTAAANNNTDTAGNVTVSTSFGLLNAESIESVYQAETANKRLSQLNWKTNNAPIVKLDISWDALPRLTLTAKAWSTLSSGQGVMDNYDWLTPQQTQWSDWSHHEKTNLNYANEIDINAKIWFFKQHNYRVGPILGYQENNHSWTAYGGNFNYNNGTNVFAAPDGIVGVGYKQKFDMLYIGLAGSYRYQQLEFNALLKYSNWVNANAYDNHYSRKVSFKDSSKNSSYYSAVIDAGYYFTENTKLFVEAAWNQYSEGRGETQTLNYATGNVGNGKSGIEHQSQTLTVGFQYKF
ncbi:omptin family outer membrane protease [Yersinia similis]|uniref:Protease n=1 Tax=Yersinia similis TaxID=367190 RepID=A0A0T9PWL6_9GAMM|nr:omptin family outer membrane protease [Yersinia similis]AHK20515.1 protease [Yersinia similis]CFQ46505.1 outer membrane protease [Yersinia similis]CNB25948.1 outer membrane protease [Yersinia similis]CNF30684.1 outer membrane protease [Yersinia similis]CNH85483.1 outer membrane protease [Yersinia similis]